MAKLSITHQTKHSSQKSFALISEFLGNPEELKKWDSKATWTEDKELKKGQIKGKQFSAQVMVLPIENGSEVKFDIEIGLLLTPLKSKITEILKSKLQKHLG